MKPWPYNNNRNTKKSTQADMSFEEWCELNGRLWVGAHTYEEFEKNMNDWFAYKQTRKGGE